MTRSEFKAAYQAARINLKTFSASKWTTGRYANLTPEVKKAAEDRWILGANNPKTELAYKAYATSLHIPGTISNAAIHDYRFCGGERKEWYLRMARERRERA